MIRPFTISNTIDYIIRIQDHRHNELINKSIKKSDNFYEKLFSHPITAFGYKIDNMFKDLPNPKFSKHDTIRALDFWIEYWVYENQKESVLTGTVNVDHEITLKELILVREKIMKMPSSTEFTRERIRVSDKPSKKKIVFTEAVFVQDSSVDPFCHKVLEMTREEYERYKKGIVRAGLFSNPLVGGGIDAIHENIMIPEQRPLQMGDLVVWNRDTNQFERAIGNEPERIRLSTETQSPEFLRWVTTGTFVIPEGTHLIAGDMMDINNDFRDVRIAHGTVTEDLHPGDVVRLDGNNRWIKIPPIDIQVSDVID